MIRDFLKRLASSRGIVEERPTSAESSAALDRPAHHNACKLGPPPAPMHSQSGVALVLVLACLVLLTVVVISLMVGATQELNTAKSYSEQVQARRLAASTLELVKGQIWAATTETTNSSWASQPGAIRTFRSGNTNLVNVYKLYSSDTMVVANTNYNPTNDWATNWASLPNEFVDLNRPVVVGGVTNYPIFNPAATNSVAGFAVTNAPGATTANLLPMPVRWIYVLRNGTLTNYSGATNYDASNPVAGRIAFWTDDDTCKLNINTASATRDGDTNSPTNATSFWDIPVNGANNTNNFEYQMAMFQPAQGEYQRYPGHPARVNLRTVFTNLSPNEIYAFAPRTATNDHTLGSYGGTKKATTNLNSTIIPNRLYASVDELFYNTNRTTNNTNITPTSLNRLEGFLTAYNRAPDLNLFGKPRVSMWPIHKNPTQRTALDRYFATASTIRTTNGGSELYSVTREDPNSSTNDLADSGTNKATIMRLFNYLNGITSLTPPGYTSTFEAKYGADGRDQLVTLSLDYIRCVNLYDSSVTTGNLTIKTSASTTTSLPYNTNAFARGDTNNLPICPTPRIVRLPGFGQVVPLRITSGTTNYKGLGRFDTTVSEALFHVWAMSWEQSGAQSTNNIISSTNTPIPVREDDVVTLLVNGVSQTRKVGEFDYSVPGVYAELAKKNRPDTNAAGIIQYGTNRPMYAAQFLVVPFGPMMGYGLYNPDYIHQVENLGSVRLEDPNAVVFPRDPAINWVRLGLNGMNYASTAGGPNGRVLDTVSNSDCDTDNGYDGKAVLFQNSTLSTPNLMDYPLASKPFPIATNTANISFSAGEITLNIFSRQETTTPIQTLKFNFPPTTIVKPETKEISRDLGTNGDTNDEWRKRLAIFYPTETAGNSVNSLNSVGASTGYMSAGRRMRTITQDVAEVGSFFNSGDSGIGVEAAGPNNSGTPLGRAADFRWLSLQNEVSADFFLPQTNYYSTSNNTNKAFSAFNFGLNAATATAAERARYLRATGGTHNRLPYPALASHFKNTGVSNAQGKLPDFETGIGLYADGAYSRKPDDGDVSSTTNNPPYGLNSTGKEVTLNSLLFSPNRQVPSPGIMGGLPSRGTEANGAWETLLFCPNPAAGTTAADHRGFNSPPDYLWLDLFTMPIVEPYPISEPFSTAGRINLNYQIVPFTYLTRSTGLHSILSANRVSACTSEQSKTQRIPIHATETLKQFDNLFASNRLFRSPAEICSIWLFPVNTTTPANPAATYSPTSITNISTWWGYGSTAAGQRFYTGDNLREQPYTALYQHLTTQANTYTVHVYVQALDQTTSGKLIVTGEYRGSYALERFLDPKDPRLPDFMNATGPNAMGYYQFRVNNTTQFLP